MADGRWLAGRSPSALGGADRDRTGYLLLAKQALSQLSYSPRQPTAVSRPLVGQGRFELPTSRLSSARSNQLSYWPGCQRSEIRCQRSDDRPSPDICHPTSASATGRDTEAAANRGRRRDEG